MKLNILLVDDDPITIMLHKMMLKTIGVSLEFITFMDGLPALRYLQENYLPGDYYLVFLDLNMEEMGGWEFLDFIQGEPFCDSLYAAIVTSSIDERDRIWAKQYNNVIDFGIKARMKDDYIKVMHSPQISNFKII